MGASIFWYDYETTGIQPSRDRPLQVAGLRTDHQLQEIAAPVNLYCRLSDDILPHPMACLVTGISPEKLHTQGLKEAEFMTRLHAELSQPNTCVAGYNSLRFDDEMTRFSLYRNFFDPYGREWQGGNSRWDLIDLVRCAYALRPEGIQWPRNAEGDVSLKLELLTQANDIAHTQAHDALSDVRATIAFARLLRQRQGRLYDYLFGLRSKPAVLERLQLLQPLLHVSGRYSQGRHYLAVVLPLAWHPVNRNALIVCDLQADISGLLEDSPEVLQQRLYCRREALPPGVAPVPLKLVHVNKCPVLAPLSVMRPSDQERLAIDLLFCQRQAETLRQRQALWQEKLPVIYGTQMIASTDPEEQLYQGFLSERDRRLCEEIRLSAPEVLAGDWGFTDGRLPELLFRYRARNYPETLSELEKQRWHKFCRERLTLEQCAAPQTLDGFAAELNKLLVGASPQQASLLQDWSAYAERLRQRYVSA